MKNISKKIQKFFKNTLAFWIIFVAIATCVGFISVGNSSENGSITLDGNNAVISENIKNAMEQYENTIYRIMNEDKPTDEETIKANDVQGQGSITTLEQVLARRLPDGHNDNGNGWQCSRYTAYLATGKWSYSTAHPDYGPVNGKDVAAWLVKNYGWKYVDKPVMGAIGSGGFNTTYGHTAMFLYSTGANTAMINDANAKPLTVSTWNMNISGWVWVVPGDYNPSVDPEPTPAPTPQPTPSATSYKVVRGDTLGEIAIKMGWCNGCKLFGDDGYAQKIAEKNGIQNRGLIYPNQVIVKP